MMKKLTRGWLTRQRLVVAAREYAAAPDNT